MTDEQEYLENLKSRVSPSSLDSQHTPAEKLSIDQPTGFQPIRVAYWHRNEDHPVSLSSDPHSVLAQCQHDVSQHVPSIVLIENISPELMGMLGTAFNVEERCWLSYLSNAEGNSAWQALFSTSGRPNVERVASRSCWHPESEPATGNQRPEASRSMDYTGQLASTAAFAQSSTKCYHTRYPRLEHWDPNHGASMSTNLTYFVLADTICLFLVDACNGIRKVRSQWSEPQWPILRVPCSDSYDGLTIPQDMSNDYFSVFAIVFHFLNTIQHRQALMSAATPKRLLDPITLSYYLSASTHRSNLKIIDSQIRDVAFRQLQTDDANDLQRLSRILHQQREELCVLQSNVAYAKKTIAPEVRDHLGRLPIDAAGDNPLITYDEVLKDASELQRFLMDTFQLLTSTINIRDAKVSIEQAERTARLTQLATVYLPMTLVTGIFGMNVREITQKDPHWWTCVITLVVVLMVTTLLIWGQTAWKKYRSGVVHDVKKWVSFHHCGKRIWKWFYRKWYRLWAR